jgi:hypothetical protein
MTLQGWTNPLPSYLENAVNSGVIKVVQVTIKGVLYELLQGSVKVGDTVLSFK